MTEARVTMTLVLPQDVYENFHSAVRKVVSEEHGVLRQVQIDMVKKYTDGLLDGSVTPPAILPITKPRRKKLLNPLPKANPVTISIGEEPIPPIVSNEKAFVVFQGMGYNKLLEEIKKISNVNDPTEREKYVYLSGLLSKMLEAKTT